MTEYDYDKIQQGIEQLCNIAMSDIRCGIDVGAAIEWLCDELQMLAEDYEEEDND